MDLSVIIVTWNSRNHLADCISSVVASCRELSHEILIVDNASGDGTGEWVRQAFPEVKLIQNSENVGFARACNQGLAQAHGRYFFLLNPDTQLQNRALAEMVAFMDDHKDIGALGCVLKDRRGKIDYRGGRRFPTLWSEFCEKTTLDRFLVRFPVYSGYLLSDWNHATSREVETLSGACILTRREVVEQVGTLDERFFMYGEDVDWCYRIKQAGWHVFYFAEAEVVHIGGQSSQLVSQRMGIEALQSMNYLFRKHYGPGYARAHAALIWITAIAKEWIYMARRSASDHTNLWDARAKRQKEVRQWATIAFFA